MKPSLLKSLQIRKRPTLKMGLELGSDIETTVDTPQAKELKGRK